MARTWGEKLEETVAILTLGAGLLALFSGVENWWIIFVVGWFVLTPLANVLVDDAPSTDHETDDGSATAHDHDDAAGVDDTADALDTLRDRYARDELTEEEFERKVERLLETETVEDAREHVGGEGSSRGSVEGDSPRAAGPDERSAEVGDERSAEGAAEPATDRESER